MNHFSVLRRALPDDGPRIRAMHRASLRSLGNEVYPATLIEKFLAEFETLDDTMLAGGTCLCVEVCGVIVASGAWTLRPQGLACHGADAVLSNGGPPRATIRSVFTDPRHVRRGLASAIMRQCEADATEHGGAAHFDLYATLSGVPLYRRLGYSILASVAVPLSGGDLFDAVQMTKPASTSDDKGADRLFEEHADLCVFASAGG